MCFTPLFFQHTSPIEKTHVGQSELNFFTDLKQLPPSQVLKRVTILQTLNLMLQMGRHRLDGWNTRWLKFGWIVEFKG